MCNLSSNLHLFLPNNTKLTWTIHINYNGNDNLEISICFVTYCPVELHTIGTDKIARCNLTFCDDSSKPCNLQNHLDWRRYLSIHCCWLLSRADLALLTSPGVMTRDIHNGQCMEPHPGETRVAWWPWGPPTKPHSSVGHTEVGGAAAGGTVALGPRCGVPRGWNPQMATK